MKNVGWKEHKKRLLENPELRAEVERLGPEFELASQIIRLRTEEGLSQTELAKRAHTSQVVISRLENVQTDPTLSTIKKVFGALGKSVEIRVGQAKPRQVRTEKQGRRKTAD
ncbi:MAG: helix-turn-helix domain-containing protein [Candidatus Aquicultorales bacterium]